VNRTAFNVYDLAEGTAFVGVLKKPSYPSGAHYIDVFSSDNHDAEFSLSIPYLRE